MAALYVPNSSDDNEYVYTKPLPVTDSGNKEPQPSTSTGNKGDNSNKAIRVVVLVVAINSVFILALVGISVFLIQSPKPNEKVSAGSTYVRWGRTSCPGNGSELVYQGVAGGSHWNNSGAAAEHLCLPLDPEYRDYTEDGLQWGALVYGVEYQLAGRTDRMKFFPDIDATPDLLIQNVPCAVCHVSRNTMIMVPAKRTCMDGWTREYEGLLVGGPWNFISATEYICLDDQPEVISGGGGTSQDGKHLYFVEGRCGSLPCPHYREGLELSCVVCTK